MKSQYIIILIIIISLTTSMLLLAKIENDQRDTNQDFWSIYFVTPLTTTDNRFVIDNKTKEDIVFHYEITVDKEVQYSNDVEIKKDERNLIDIKDWNNQSIKIIVTSDKNKKEIEKK